ncbi:MAG: hypothetical protein H8D23_07000 [Candidatus Brocadiales bacterium]|nr:hypothetical protein [Candidatus Brocadiales bacterium]
MNNVIKSSILGLVLITTASGQFYLGGSFNYYLHHSENTEPTFLSDPIKSTFGAEIGYEVLRNGSRYTQIELGYNENFDERFSQWPDVLGIREQYYLEQNVSLNARLWYSSQGKTGYGIGPVLGITKHTFVLDQNYLEPFKEITYSNSLGLSGLVRYGWPILGNLYGIISLELKYMRSVWNYHAIQDFSEYIFDRGVMRLSMGVTL